MLRILRTTIEIRDRYTALFADESMCVANVSFAMLHSEILPEHTCDGELIPLMESSTYLQVVLCSSCGTEFSFEPDSDWVTVVYPGMRN